MHPSLSDSSCISTYNPNRLLWSHPNGLHGAGWLFSGEVVGLSALMAPNGLAWPGLASTKLVGLWCVNRL
jgi:hypothetical protein